jgi:hypothetical protein
MFEQLLRLLIYSIFIHSSMALQFFAGPWPLLQFRNLCYTDGRTPWTSDQPVARPLPTHRTTQTQNKSTRNHPLGFEPTIPSFERVKTVHAVDRAATVIRRIQFCVHKFLFSNWKNGGFLYLRAYYVISCYSLEVIEETIRDVSY